MGTRATLGAVETGVRRADERATLVVPGAAPAVAAEPSSVPDAVAAEPQPTPDAAAEPQPTPGAAAESQPTPDAAGESQPTPDAAAESQPIPDAAAEPQPTPDAAGARGHGRTSDAGLGHGPAAEGLSDEAAELNELVHTLLHTLRREAVERFGATVATPGQQRLLRALHRAGTPRRLGELALALDVAPRSVTAKVDQAEADGQVRRIPDPNDRRATLVELTPAGRDVLLQVSAQRSLGAAERLARLTPDERAELLQLLRRLVATSDDTCR